MRLSVRRGPSPQWWSVSLAGAELKIARVSELDALGLKRVLAKSERSLLQIWRLPAGITVC